MAKRVCKNPNLGMLRNRFWKLAEPLSGAWTAATKGNSVIGGKAGKGKRD
jgi:hypothetical protein